MELRHDGAITECVTAAPTLRILKRTLERQLAAPLDAPTWAFEAGSAASRIAELATSIYTVVDCR
jgi:hypothetical protein